LRAQGRATQNIKYVNQTDGNNGKGTGARAKVLFSVLPNIPTYLHAVVDGVAALGEHPGGVRLPAGFGVHADGHGAGGGHVRSHRRGFAGGRAGDGGVAGDGGRGAGLVQVAVAGDARSAFYNDNKQQQVQRLEILTAS